MDVQEHKRNEFNVEELEPIVFIRCTPTQASYYPSPPLTHVRAFMYEAHVIHVRMYGIMEMFIVKINTCTKPLTIIQNSIVIYFCSLEQCTA